MQSSETVDRPANRNGVAGFYRQLMLRVGERGVTALGVFVNSVLIARTLENQEAAAYFLVVSVCQLVIAPWIASADFVWIRYHADGIAPAQATRRVAVPVAWGSLLSTLVTIAACAPFVSGTGSWVILLTCASGSLIFGTISLLFASKFGEPSRYIGASVIGGGVAVLLKLGALILTDHEKWTYVVLFCESYLIAALALLVRPKLPRLPKLPPLRELLMPFAAPAFLVISSVFSLRFALLVTSQVLDDAEYVTFGLAFQILNAVSVLSVAVSHSVAAASLNPGNRREVLASAVRRGFIAAGALFVCFSVFMLAVGRPVLEFLLQARGPAVHELVIDGLAYSAYVLVQGVGSALASMIDAIRAYAWALLVITVLTVAVLAFFPSDDLGTRVIGWSVVSLLAGLGVSVWLLRRAASRPG
ncbi:MAG TPA: hypothetical protein PKA20_05890 [Burkholderiaceae bacterium]|nr:hypothetical protein [Burkholderiaceae bacterium]